VAKKRILFAGERLQRGGKKLPTGRTMEKKRGKPGGNHSQNQVFLPKGKAGGETLKRKKGGERREHYLGVTFPFSKRGKDLTNK